MSSAVKRLAALCAVLLTSASLAFNDWCGYGADENRVTYSYTDPIHARFVFVDFPDDTSYSFLTMHDYEQQAVVEKVKWWLSASTHQELNFADERSIVFKPGDDFSDGTAEAWRARLTGYQYKHFYELEQDTIDAYETQFENISDWWVDAPDSLKGLTRLNAEILYKIYRAYTAEVDTTWPFGVYTSGPRNVDLLFFISH